MHPAQDLPGVDILAIKGPASIPLPLRFSLAVVSNPGP